MRSFPQLLSRIVRSVRVPRRQFRVTDISPWLLVITLAVTFLHNFAFNAGTFYLALYFQVRRFLSGYVRRIADRRAGCEWTVPPRGWYDYAAILARILACFDAESVKCIPRMLTRF